jgi:hypothetical protein
MRFFSDKNQQKKLWVLHNLPSVPSGFIVIDRILTAGAGRRLAFSPHTPYFLRRYKTKAIPQRIIIAGGIRVLIKIILL